MTDDVLRFKRRKPANASTIPFYLDDELFHAVPALPGGMILDFAALTSLTVEQQATMSKEELDKAGAESLAAVTELLDTAIVPNDRDRWRKAIRTITDEGDVADLALVMEVGAALAARYAANPTGESSPPSTTTASTRSGSSGGASPTESSTFTRAPRPRRSR